MRTKAGDMSRGPRRLWEYSLRRLIPAGGAVLLMAAWGCHSAFVETTIKNNGPTPIHVIEVDYPSASFGTQTLAARSAYNYRFKIQGSEAELQRRQGRIAHLHRSRSWRRRRGRVDDNDRWREPCELVVGTASAQIIPFPGSLSSIPA
jgi:hypothetical protein